MIDYMKRTDIFSDFRRGLSNSDIARDREVSRTTVIGLRKIYDQAQQNTDNPKALDELIQSVPRYKGRNALSPVLTQEIKKIIDDELAANVTKAATGRRKQQKKATDIFVTLCDKGYNVSYRTVARYISMKKGPKPGSVYDCFIMQEYVPGERMEFDWGSVTLTIGGKSEKFNMAVVSLCSNGRWAKLFKRQDKQALLEAHVNCFDFWGHVPSLMVYDNMRTAVKSFVGEKKPTAEICQLQAFYGFQHVFCNVRAGNEKPHVERSVDVVRRDAFAFRDTFDTLEEANAYLLSVCQKSNEERQEQIQVEIDSMIQVYGSMSCFETMERSVDKEALFCLDSNKYSVPYIYCHKKVWIKKYSDEIVVYTLDKNNRKEIARHRRSHEKNKYILEIDHYLEVMRAKPKSVKNSLALKQTSDELQQVFRTHFEDNPRDFINLLIWARNNKISHEDLCSVVLVAESQGRRTITSEVIQKLMVECKKNVEIVELPWSKIIEDGTKENSAILGRMFNSRAMRS